MPHAHDLASAPARSGALLDRSPADTANSRTQRCLPSGLTSSPWSEKLYMEDRNARCHRQAGSKGTIMAGSSASWMRASRHACPTRQYSITQVICKIMGRADGCCFSGGADMAMKIGDPYRLLDVAGDDGERTTHPTCTPGASLAPTHPAACCMSQGVVTHSSTCLWQVLCRPSVHAVCETAKRVQHVSARVQGDDDTTAHLTWV